MQVQFDLLKHGNLALRVTQLLFSVIAISTVGAGFKGHEYTVHDGKETVTLAVLYSSHTSQFVLLQTYTAMVFTVLYLIFVETPVNPTATYRPRRIAEFAVDGGLAVLYLIAGIALSASSVVAHCDIFNRFTSVDILRCGNLTCCCVFLFLAFVAHLCSMALVFFVESKGSFAKLLHPQMDLEDTAQTPQPEENPPTCAPLPYSEEATPKQTQPAMPMA